MSETTERQLLVTVDPSIGYRALERVPGVVAVEPAAPEPAAAMAESREPRHLNAGQGAQIRELRALAAEILGSFDAPEGDGYRARVGQVQIAKWRERAGIGAGQ